MKLLAQVMIGLWIIVAGYFFWEGATSKPQENDSLMWHIPIAENLLKGRIWGRDLYHSKYGYYPAMGEMVLALFILLKIPLNLYNWLGWVILFGVTVALGKRRGLDYDLAIILAGAVVFLPTVMRLFPTQLIDVWLVVWWGWLLWLLEKPKTNLSYWISLGVVAGLVVGTKYTGIVFLLLAMITYYNKLKKVGSVKNWLWLAIMVGGIGGFWYVRNLLVWNDPLYPQNFLWFKGYQTYQLPIIWKDLLFSVKGWELFIQAIFSEYLIWGLLLFLPIIFRNAWVWMGILIVGLYLLLPGDAQTVISNFRYVVPGFMLLILSAGEYFKKIKREEWLGKMAVVSAVSVLPQLDYHPKLWILMMFVWGVYTWYRKYDKSVK